MRTKQIKVGAVYEGRRGERRVVVEVYDEYVSFTCGNRHNPREAADAAITLKAFARWAQHEILP